MNEQELKELLKSLEEHGWEPRLCDTEYTYYDTPIVCGMPTPVGDIITDTTMMPEGYLKKLEEFLIRAKGDSMEGASIFDGDMVKINTQAQVYDGDIVAVWVDGDYTLKTYCVDKDGTPWLVPQNPAYDAFTFEDKQDVRIVGKALEVLHPNPHVSYRSCEKYISKAKEKLKDPEEISPLQVARIIREIAPQITIARLWYAVFKAMMEADVVKLWDYDAFCALVKEEVPHHHHLPSRLELQRMAIGSFAKSIVLWTETDAPVRGKRFETYKKLAQQTKEMLGD